MNRDRRRTRLLLTLLLLTAFTLITLDYRAGSGNPFGFLRTAGDSVFGPLERGASAVARPVGDILDDLAHLGRDRDRINELEQENADLKENARLNELEATRAPQVEKLLNLAGRGRFRIAPARVVGIGSGLGFEWTATLDVGSRQGIRKDMTVINGDGLVGKIEEVGPTTSTVLLAVDREFTAFGRSAKTLEVGPVRGAGRQGLTLELLSQTAPLAKGERFVTLGKGGGSLFVPEIPIGIVRRVVPTPGALTRTAEIRPYVNFSALDIVGVVVAAPPQIKRNSLLPPSPTPSPSPGSSTSPAPEASTSVSPRPSPSRSR